MFMAPLSRTVQGAPMEVKFNIPVLLNNSSELLNLLAHLMRIVRLDLPLHLKRMA